MFFESWEALLRIIIVGTLAYIGLILLLRISGNRTLSKMTAYDFVVTVALGSTLATVLLSKDVVLMEGLLALGLLIGLQRLVAFLAMRFHWINTVVKSNPVLLFFRGEFLMDALRKQRVTEDEIRSAARQNGFASLENIQAVVLEIDGSFTVLGELDSSRSTLSGVRNHPQADQKP